MLRLHFFGVGDGDCIVVELPNGQVGLIDSNYRPHSQSSPALEMLKGRSLAFCCLTHPHADHYSGMLEVLKAVDPPKPPHDRSTFWYALSDLGEVFADLFHPVVIGADSDFSESEREKELGDLFELFDWIRDSAPAGFSECITNVTHVKFNDVALTLVGPTPFHWNRYRQALKRQRERRVPLRNDYANRISIGILLKYAGQSVWLLGDLTRAPLRSLPKRIELHTPEGASSNARASILKVPHHGALNGWFRGMEKELMRCDPEDVVVFSANGRAHPHDDVWSEWGSSGKRVLTTWTSDEVGASSDFGGWARDALDAVSTVIDTAPRDVTITVHPDGQIDLGDPAVVASKE